MKLVRFLDGEARIGAVKGDGIVDLVANGSRWRTVREIAAAGNAAIHQLGAIVDRAEIALTLSNARLLAPIERPGKYLGSGLIDRARR